MKKIKWKIGVLLPAGLLLASCAVSKWPGSDEIIISWEVISNTYYEPESRVKAKFTIENQSRLELNDKNWIMYFNQAPRSLINDGTSSGARVERINGDWYRLIPQEGFKLLPGETFTFTYESGNWWIKESDAPNGLYFVFQDDNGKEHIVEATNYTIVPFTRKEQISRHLMDYEPFPAPDVLFRQNENLDYINPQNLPPVIPTPVSITNTFKHIQFSADYNIYYDGKLQSEASHLQNKLKDLLDWDIYKHDGFSDDNNSINLLLDGFTLNGVSKGAYHIEIDEPGKITLRGSDPSGIFYGIQSLLALIPVEAIGANADQLDLPVLKIKDAPRFDYRGVHVDVSRNFFPKETILKMIDILSFYKINTLHMHLTDDEGWRLEIKALPELTQVGAQRKHTTKDAPALHPAYGSGPFPYAEGKTGSGYYTREDFIEILQYAKKHHITVIPEINMPGHSRAAIKAMEARYNYYMERGDEEAADEYRLIDPQETSKYLSAQLFTDNVVNVARESAYRFFETVLDEVIDIYELAGTPLNTIHLGGDEVPAGAWSASPMIDALMEKLEHIDNPRNMHSYFTERVLEILGSRGLKMAGWEEVALLITEEGEHVPNSKFADGSVIPYVWNNLWGAQDLAYRLANRGFPVVLCHVTAFYFDLAYNNDPKEPGLYWGGFVKTRDAWHYNPYNVFKTTTHDNMGRAIDIETEYRNMERLNPASINNILGLQAQIWSETILNSDMLEYYLLPKLIGFAESAWAKERVWETTADKNLRNQQVEEQWNIFANALGQRELPRLAKLFGGYNYRIPTPGALYNNGVLQANVEFPGLQIRYTTDGSEPGPDSQLYTGEIELSVDSVKLRAFDAAGRSSRTVFVEDNLINP